MRILDEFNENIESEIGALTLTPDQIRRSLLAEQEFEAEIAARDLKASQADKKKEMVRDEAPVIPKEQLREMLGLQMDSAEEQVPLEIKTDIGMKTRRESNIFERRIDALGETVFSYYPTIHATTRQQGWSYSSDYRMNRFLYMNFSHNDRVDHDWSQTLSRKISKVTWNFSSDLTASSIKSELESVKPDRFATSSFRSGLDYELSAKTSLGIDYKRETLTYKSDTKSSLDTRNHSVDAHYNYTLSPRTRLRGGMIFRVNQPPKGLETDNIKFFNYYMGVSGQFSNKLFYNLLGSLDYAKRSMEELPMREFLSVTGAMTYVYSPKTRITLNASRGQVATVTETASDPENIVTSLTIRHNLTPKISLSAGESIRIINGDGNAPTRVVDPDYPSDIFTANKYEVHWGTNVGLAYNLDRSSKFTVSYNYLNVDSKLKIDSRINHICEVAYEKKF